MVERFIAYGVIGWCMEIIWTGLHSLQRKDFSLTSNTSLWMFFIYGMAIFLEPISDFLKQIPVMCRGGVYVLCIFLTEYITGWLLKKFNSCPWDYSDSKYHVHGLIRLDYAPVWFIAGLIFETAHYIIIK